MGGDCWVLPDSRVEKLEQHSGQLGLFQLSQMSQECAELGTTSQLPSLPPPLTLHLLAGARPHPLAFLILFWGAWLPSDPLTTPQPSPSVFCRSCQRQRLFSLQTPVEWLTLWAPRLSRRGEF